MKKFIAIFILFSIFLSSFFAQIEKNTDWRCVTTIHDPSTHSNDYNHNRTPIFIEVSSESEDTESKSNIEFKFPDFENVLLENKYIKNILGANYIHQVSNISYNHSIPIFIQVRSILI